MFKKAIVIDGKGHLMGRLASYIAKNLLAGTLIITQASVSSLFALKALISPAPFSATRSSSANS